MKAKLMMIATLFVAMLSFGQDERESIGAAGGYSYGYSQPKPLSESQRLALERNHEIARQNFIFNFFGGQVYRTVKGKTYNAITDYWSELSGNLYEKDDGIVILEHRGVDYSRSGRYDALTNYYGNETSHENINAFAMWVGNYDDGGRPIDLYDCGTPATAAEMKPIKDAEAAEADSIKVQNKALQIASRKKFLIGQTNAVHWLIIQATNGDSSAQCSLGEHYLAGQGCETNRELGTYWLTQAANQGDMEASNKLDRINGRTQVAGR